MSNNSILISIITVVYNAESTIEETILSVVKQHNKNIEYILVDGGSTDATIVIISRYKNFITKFISENDNGIYDAMNKGISFAKGDYICFINSGDTLLDIPEQLLDCTADLVCFPVRLTDKKTILYPKINNSIKLHNTLPHQGCYYRNTPSLKFDTTYKVFADFHLNQVFYKKNKLIKVFNAPISATHDLIGISNNKKYSSEIFRVVKDNFGMTYLICSWIFFKFQGIKKRLKLK